MGGDAGDPGGPAALCKLSMEWVCQVGGKNKLQLILNKASRYVPAYFGTIDELFESSDDTLFNSVINNPDHCVMFASPSIQEYRIQSAQTQSWTKFADSTF